MSSDQTCRGSLPLRGSLAGPPWEVGELLRVRLPVRASSLAPALLAAVGAQPVVGLLPESLRATFFWRRRLEARRRRGAPLWAPRWRGNGRG